MENVKIKLALISTASFPVGNVSTLRYSSYCQAISDRGCFVKIYVLAPSFMASSNLQKKGRHKGVYFQYMTEITWKKKPNVFFKSYYYLIGLVKSVIYLKKDRINCLILYYQGTFIYWFYWIITRLLSIKFITDKSEYPQGYFKMNSGRRKIEFLNLKLFDGFIIMTKELMDFYALHKSKRAQLFHLPMTIDVNRFDGIEKEEIKSPYIAVVFGVHNRDGVYESLIAYHRYLELTTSLPYRLVLLGDFNKMPNAQLLKEYISNNGLKENVEIKGLIPINQIPHILINASCLLTTPNSYSSGGFPTKLGEYMLSGIPIVATTVGEITDYIVDHQHAFLAPPGDFEKIAGNILYIQNNPDIALQVANNAKDLVSKVFNAKEYTWPLLDFLKKL